MVATAGEGDDAMALREYLISEVTQDYTDGLMTRREAMHRLGLLAVSAGTASALLAACGDGGGREQPPSTSSVPSSDAAATGAGVAAEMVRFDGPSGELQAAWATAPEARAGVLVIHENRGLTPHFHDLVGRLAGQGYGALCVDLLSQEGGTENLGDPAAAPAALAAAPLDRLLDGLRAGIDELERRQPGAAVGAVGFCFGGGMAWNLLDAGEPRLAAVVPFYGPAPRDPDFSGARAAVLGIYAGLDDRVNASRARAEAALAAAGLTYQIRTFEGADHAFFNDTGRRYHPQAAAEAYAALLDWFDRYLR
jgi:carboxymethylenebutenolidase